MSSLPNLLTPKDIKAYLKCNNKRVYELCSRRDFPSFRIGSKYYIQEDKFLEWMDKQQKISKTS